MDIGEKLAIYLVIIALPLIFIGVPIFVLSGGLQKFGLRSLERCYVGLNPHETRQPGDVQVVYHTYRGFLVWFIQDEHRVSLPVKHAELLLKRLLRFNLTWGMMSYGLLFVPLLAIGNYYVQRRSVARQQREMVDLTNSQ
ncbi:MAG: hypothetical protein Q8K78_16130 [Planctomycetaceae bacterium]|nr:hypothetical protein [Planctomycetaceae bacterium]